MQNMTNPADRALFIFDFNTNSHNSLKTIVKLNAKVSMSKMAIYTEAFDNRSTKYVYIFFGGKTFQLFKFEPDNVLVPDSVFSTLFMPYDIRSLSTYSQSNVTLSIYPLVHDRIHTFRHTSLNLCIQSQNYGLMMEKRDIGREIIYIKNDASLNLSLLDYFDGYDQNYAVMIDDDFINNHHDVISDVNDDTYDTFFIDSVSTTNIVTKAILFKNNFLILFFSNNHLMQLYTIFDEISKESKDYNSYELFGNCEVTFINFIKLPRDFDFLVVQCLEVTDFIDASYVLKFFTVDINDKNEIEVRKITSVLMNRKAKDVLVVNSSLEKEDLYVIILTNEGIKTDSIIYFVRMNCIQSCNTQKDSEEQIFMNDIGTYLPQESEYLNYSKNEKLFKKENESIKTINLNLECKIGDIDIYTGVKLNIDQFIVNSFMFINNEPLFVVSVDNYGLLVIDTVSKSVVDTISFTKIIENFPQLFSITNIFPIDTTGIRILLKGKGGFSLFWDRIGKIGDQEHIFIELTVLDYQISFYEGTIDYLMDYSKGGYSTIVLSEVQGSTLYHAKARVYFYFNHEKSKISKEIELGIVSSCNFIAQRFSISRLVLVCGTKIYLVNVSVYPWVYLEQKSKRKQFTLQIFANNDISSKELKIYIENIDITTYIQSWILGLCFICSVILISCFCSCIHEKLHHKKIENIEKVENIEHERSQDSSRKLIELIKSSQYIRKTPEFTDPADIKENKYSHLIFENNKSIDTIDPSFNTNILFSQIRAKNASLVSENECSNNLKENPHTEGSMQFERTHCGIQNYSVSENSKNTIS